MHALAGLRPPDGMFVQLAPPLGFLLVPPPQVTKALLFRAPAMMPGVGHASGRQRLSIKQHAAGVRRAHLHLPLLAPAPLEGATAATGAAGHVRNPL